MPRPENGRVTLDLALVGFGNVGRRLVRLLEERRTRLERDHDLRWRLAGVATRRLGAALDCSTGLDPERTLALADAGGQFSALHDATAGAAPADALALVSRIAAGVGAAPPGTARHVPVVVETTVLDVHTGRPAIDHVEAALHAGVHVVTTNKGPVAFAYDRLRRAATAAGVRFLFEGAVMDGIPVFNLVRDTLPAVGITGFRGVLNSTTNHALAEMEAGRDLADALRDMQAAGIAEADPSLDVDGWDAAAKTAALMNVLMDARTTPHEIDRTGIGGLSASAVRDARARGRRVKLVASARRAGDRVTGAVAPEELEDRDPLARVHGTENALILDTDLPGQIAVGELDSGLTQTAYALLSDLVSLRRALDGR